MIIMFLMILVAVLASVTISLWTAYLMAIVDTKKKIKRDKGVNAR